MDNISKNMKSYLLVLFCLCLTQIINCEGNKNEREHYDLSDSVDHVFVVQLIFQKLNNISTDTAKIAASVDSMNKRMDALDKRVDGVSTDFGNFKTEITNKVQDQTNLVQTSMSASGVFNQRLDELNTRLNASSKDIVTFKSDISKTVQDRNEAFKRELNQRFDEMNQQLKKSATEIGAFKTEISKTINDQNVAIRKITNETSEVEKRQQDQIRTLWENGSTNKKTGWITILRRQDGTVDFNRSWTDYRNGFGNHNGEFFIGLEALHKLTSNGLPHELLITLEHFDNRQMYAKYDNIVIGSESEDYMLKELGNHSGDADDSLRHHEGEKFTTIDRDNDHADSVNCAKSYNGPWWFYQCNPSSQLFGPYNTQNQRQRIRWSLNKLYQLKFVEVKIRQT